MKQFIIKTVGIGFCIGGFVHWMIIFGLMQELTPILITIYFHSLAILSPACGIGILLSKAWGRKLGFFIACTQIPAHLYMLWLDHFTNWQSGVNFSERSFDLVFAVFYIIFFNIQRVKKMFS